MPTTRYTHNRAGLGALLKGDKLRADLGRRAEAVRRAAEAKADPDQEIAASTFTGRNRVRASVIAPGGLADELEERFLGSSIDAARG